LHKIRRRGPVAGEFYWVTKEAPPITPIKKFLEKRKCTFICAPNKDPGVTGVTRGVKKRPKGTEQSRRSTLLGKERGVLTSEMSGAQDGKTREGIVQHVKDGT